MFCGAGILNFFQKILIKKLRYYFNLPALERFYAVSRRQDAGATRCENYFGQVFIHSSLRDLILFAYFPSDESLGYSQKSLWDKAFRSIFLKSVPSS